MADDLPGIVDSFRWPESPIEPSALPAYALFQTDPGGERFVIGDQVNGIYGLLLHLTSAEYLSEIKRTGRLGNPGVYLTPTPYSAWQGSAELGPRDQFDRCLLVDVSACARLWGPGRAEGSSFGALRQSPGSTFNRSLNATRPVRTAVLNRR